MAGTPGGRAQFADDRIIADVVLAKGYAYAATYCELTERLHREDLGPSYDEATLAGSPSCTSGPGCDTFYDHGSRHASVRQAVQRVSLDGESNFPLVTVYGDQDALLPPALQGGAYGALALAAGREGYHRSYVFTGATDVDGLLTLGAPVTAGPGPPTWPVSTGRSSPPTGGRSRSSSGGCWPARHRR